MRLYTACLIIVLLSSVISAQSDEFPNAQVDTNVYAASYLGITTTPYTIPKGALNYQNLYIGYNGLEYGITDRFSLSAGLSLFRFETSGNTFFLFGKYNLYQSPTTAISLSNLNIIYPEEDERGWVSVLYANGAFGNKNHFFTLGGGYGLDIDNSEPVLIFTAGYHNRFSKRIGLMIDVWLAIVDLDSRGVGIPLPSIGFRFFLNNQITIDLGLPLLGFKIPIRKVKQKSVMKKL